MGRFGPIGVLSVVVVLVAALSASASFRGQPGGIAYDFWEGQSMEIGVLRPDGSQVGHGTRSAFRQATSEARARRSMWFA